MGRAGGDLLGENRGHHLADRIDVEHPFDSDDYIVGRTQPDGAAPHDTPAFAFDHPADRGDVEVDGCQYFHRVGGAGRRGDRPRGCLGHDQAFSGHDRDDDRRRAISRQSADTMLVDDDRAGPAQPLTDINHGPGEPDGFILIERHCRTGRHEGCEMDIAVPTLGDVADDRGEGLFAKPVPVDATAYVAERGERLGVRDLDQIVVTDTEPMPRCLGQAYFPGRRSIARAVQQGNHHFVVAGTEADLRPRGEAFGSADRAVVAHDCNEVVAGCGQAEAARPQRRRDGLRIGLLDCRSSHASRPQLPNAGTLHDQFSSSEMRFASTCAPVGSP